LWSGSEIITKITKPGVPMRLMTIDRVKMKGYNSWAFLPLLKIFGQAWTNDSSLWTLSLRFRSA